ncbi:hypothetical protein BpHYR1_049065 [Brachionus plicatilis]|uniref:Uncharacterized protein n=1 Tax=Brachionus plicatilis TaxID=10195 RepID=A0A3M7SPE8_BRAPC|nr:hypothetical protein BpHYR1_049065 [Brachionus plicatilis]
MIDFLYPNSLQNPFDAISNLFKIIDRHKERVQALNLVILVKRVQIRQKFHKRRVFIRVQSNICLAAILTTWDCNDMILSQ